MSSPRWACGRCGTQRESVRPTLDPRFGYGYCRKCRRDEYFARVAFADAPGLARSDHPATAHEAAAAILPRSGTLRRRVFDHIAAAGELGATDAEIQRELDMPGNTQRPRRVELIEAGLIIDSGRRRTEHGRRMIVWVAVAQAPPA